MSGKLATVFGGTGFLGLRIVEALAGAGWRVRVAARRPGAARVGTGVEYVAADVRESGEVKRALEGASAVVNAVSLYVEGNGATFENIHVEAAALLATRASESGVGRFVQISGLGVDADSPSAYVRARALGEQAVRIAFPGATILRPSVIFGPGDAFLSTLKRLTLAPVIPLFGQGLTRLQPVHVEDVAAAAVRALDDEGTAGRVYELGGPEVLEYRSVVRLVLDHLGRRRPLMPVPFAAWRTLAGLASLLPGPPLTRDQVRLMERDNVVGTDALGFSDLGIAPRSLETTLADSLPR